MEAPATDSLICIQAVWMPRDAKAAGAVLGEFGPLFLAYWQERRPEGYGEFDFNVEGFIRHWMSRELVLVEIRFNKLLVGYVMAFVRQMMFCRDKYLHIGCVYIRPDFRKRGLMRRARDYLKQLAPTFDAMHVYRDTEDAGKSGYVVLTEEV
jgi:GNAT superfamily N-acetyltransferase